MKRHKSLKVTLFLCPQRFYVIQLRIQLVTLAVSSDFHFQLIGQIILQTGY